MLLPPPFARALRRLLTHGLMHPHRFVLHLSMLVLLRLLILCGAVRSLATSWSFVERMQLRAYLPDLQLVWVLRTRLFTETNTTVTPTTTPPSTTTSTTTHGHSTNLQLTLLFLRILHQYFLLFPQVRPPSPPHISPHILTAHRFLFV
jgi:hypothetical protein